MLPLVGRRRNPWKILCVTFELLWEPIFEINNNYLALRIFTTCLNWNLRHYWNTKSYKSGDSEANTIYKSKNGYRLKNGSKTCRGTGTFILSFWSRWHIRKWQKEGISSSIHLKSAEYQNFSSLLCLKRSMLTVEY